MEEEWVNWAEEVEMQKPFEEVVRRKPEKKVIWPSGRGRGG